VDRGWTSRDQGTRSALRLAEFSRRGADRLGRAVARRGSGDGPAIVVRRPGRLHERGRAALFTAG